MQSAANMSYNELTAEIALRKVRAFDKAMALVHHSTEALAAQGYRHWSDPILYAASLNNARVADWDAVEKRRAAHVPFVNDPDTLAEIVRRQHYAKDVTPDQSGLVEGGV